MVLTVCYLIANITQEQIMRYELSQRDEKPIVDSILSRVNFVLSLIIVFCANYMVVNFLF